MINTDLLTHYLVQIFEKGMVMNSLGEISGKSSKNRNYLFEYLHNLMIPNINESLVFFTDKIS